MVKQNKLLVTMLSTAILAVGAVTLIVKDINSSASDRSQTSSSGKKSSSSSSATAKHSWEKNAQEEGLMADGSSVKSTNSSESDSSSTSTAKSGSSSSSSSNSNSSQKGTTIANTLTEDDFRSSDDLAYRMIALYGMVNGDASWKALKSASSLVMTRQSDSVPTFLVTDGQSGKGSAYYRYVMSSNDTEVQDKPLSFSKNDAKKYRATLEDVIDFVNAQGGRAVVERLNFKLVN